MRATTVRNWGISTVAAVLLGWALRALTGQPMSPWGVLWAGAGSAAGIGLLPWTKRPR